jgi:hypothetical protein
VTNKLDFPIGTVPNLRMSQGSKQAVFLELNNQNITIAIWRMFHPFWHTGWC